VTSAARPALVVALGLNGAVGLLLAALLALPVMAPAVAADTGLPASALGAYSFLMWTAAMLASGAIGRFIARAGALRTVQASLVLAAVALLCGATGHLVGLVAAPPLIGIACAMETPASSDVLARVTAPAHRNFIFSLKQTGVQIGGMVAGVAFPAALPALGWRGTMVAVALLLVAWALALEPLCRRLDRRRPPAPPAAAGPGGLARVWRTPALRNLATTSFAFHAMQICLNTFLVAYLVGEHGFSLAAAGFQLALAQFGGFVGRLGFGLVIGPRFGVVRLLVAAGFGMTAAGLATGLFAGSLPPAGLGVLSFVFGLTAAGWNGVFLAEIARQSPPGEIARITGGVMMSAYAGLILGPVAFSAAAAAATLGAGYVLLSLGTFAGTLVLRRTQSRPAAPTV
jgi:predicted MFS family arabinose efflux permease